MRESVSALAPIVAPSEVPWGVKAFTGYLGPDRATWRAHDATELVKRTQLASEILVDQGTADKFLERELQPERFEAACAASGQKLRLRRHEGYDHSYYFIATFMADHLRHNRLLLSRSVTHVTGTSVTYVSGLYRGRGKTALSQMLEAATYSGPASAAIARCCSAMSVWMPERASATRRRAPPSPAPTSLPAQPHRGRERV